MKEGGVTNVDCTHLEKQITAHYDTAGANTKQLLHKCPAFISRAGHLLELKRIFGKGLLYVVPSISLCAQRLPECLC